MAVRTITTKLTLDGEAEYRAKIKNINAELSLHKSQMEKVQAQYKTQANSTEALGAKYSALKAQLVDLHKKHTEQEGMLEKAQEAYKKYAKEVSKLEAQQKELQNSTEGSAQAEKQLQEELDTAKASMDKAANSVTFYQRQLNLTERDQASLKDQLKQTKGYLDEAKASTDQCATSIDQYGKEVKEAGEASDKFGKQSTGAVEALAQAIVAAGIAEKVKDVAAALYGCVDTFAAFQAQMSAVQAVSGASGAELEALAEKAKEMGASTSFTAEEAGKALEYMAMAGWKTEDMLDGLEGVMHLAAASGEDLGATSDIVTDALTAFGLSARDSGHFADVLASASSNANTNVGIMGETFQYAAPVAGALGYSIEDVALAVGLMANAGIKGSQAGTVLRTTLTNLSKPSKDVAKYMDRLGVSLTDSRGSVRSLSELMGDLRKRFQDLTEAEKAEYAAGIAGKEAMSGLLAIVNAGEEDYRKLADAINGCSGAAERMSQTRLDNYAGQITLLNSAVDGFKAAVGESLAPALGNLAEAGTEAFGWAAAFVEEHPWVVQAVAGVTGAVGLLAVGLGGYAAAAAAARAVQAELNLTMSLCPIVAVTAAAGALLAVMAGAAAKAAEISEGTRKLTKSIQESKTAYEELTAAMKEENGSVSASMKALKELLASEDKSAARKEQILRLVDKLNDAMPDLKLAYDETADAINTTSDALDRAAQSMAADQEHEAQVDRLAELRVEYQELGDQVAETQEKLSGLVGEAQWDGFAGLPVNDAAVAVERLRDDLTSLTAAQTDAAAQIAELEASVGAYSQRQTEASASTGEMTQRVDALVERVQALDGAYQASYDKAYESISGQVGLFQELDGAANTSIGNLIESLKGQVAYMESYSENIRKAMELGVDEGLVQKLSDGSEESARILDAIVQGSADDIRALNEELAKVEEGKENFAGTVAEMETDFQKKMQELTEDMKDAVHDMDLKDDAYRAGWNNIQGLIDGTAAQKRALVAKYTEMGKAAIAAYKKAVDQHSPSRKFYQAGSYDIQGLIQGAEARKAQLDAAYRDMARTALESMERHLPRYFLNPGAVLREERNAGLDAAVKRLGAESRAAGQGSGISARELAGAVREALNGAAVNMSGRKVGELVTNWQRNNERGMGV